MPFFLAPLIAATASYITPVVSSVVLGIVGGYYWKSSKNEQEVSEELQRLQALRERTRRRRDQSIQNLATNTGTQIQDLALNTHTQHQQIASATLSLEEDRLATDKAKHELDAITTLIDKVTQSLGQEAQPLISELKQRLTSVTLTLDDLIKTRDKLVSTVERLDSTVGKHVEVQRDLASDSQTDKRTIQGLISQLSDMATQQAKTQHAPSREEIQILRRQSLQLAQEATALQQQNGQFSSLLQQASAKIKEQRSEIESLQKNLSVPSEATNGSNGTKTLYSPSLF